MPKRLLLGLVLALLPLVAQADNLGPAAMPLPGTGGSNADSAALQPAGQAPLQANTNASGGLAAPAQPDLQAPVSNDATLRVLVNDTDGPPHRGQPAALTVWDWSGLSLILLLMITAGLRVLADRRRFRRTNP